jgi:HPt (histidine-containing phosphotransfer) domain-containing protein
MPQSNDPLPSFNYIDTSIGLKYLNGNKILYLKILNNFLLRYKDTKQLSMDEISLKNTIHTIKGLSATLGMTNLTKSATKIEKFHQKESLLDFFIQLQEVIHELETLFIQNKEEIHSTILIIEDNRENIDKLIEILDAYDILIAINRYEALEIFDQEEIDIVLLNSKLQHTSGREIFDFLKQYTNINNIPNIFIDVPFQPNELVEEIEEKLQTNNKKFTHLSK